MSLAESGSEIVSTARSYGWSVEGLNLFYEGRTPTDLVDVQTILHPAELELPAVLEAVLDRIEELKPQRSLARSRDA